MKSGNNLGGFDYLQGLIQKSINSVTRVKKELKDHQLKMNVKF